MKTIIKVTENVDKKKITILEILFYLTGGLTVAYGIYLIDSRFIILYILMMFNIIFLSFIIKYKN